MEGRQLGLVEMLWDTYKRECPYAEQASKLFATPCDHIAFRSVRTGYDAGEHGRVKPGIEPIEAIWAHLGWKTSAQYDITGKKIFAIHMEPPHKSLPKIFISEYKTEELPKDDRSFVNKVFDNPREILNAVDRLNKLSTHALYEFFHISLYPEAPTMDEINKLNKIDQYLAWVRLFGRKPNHFTLLVNSILRASGPPLSIKEVYNTMVEAGIPMKPEIEGEGTELAQTSTEAAEATVCVVKENGQAHYTSWPYAYYEIAERGTTRFEGFKVGQTKSLFDMTKNKEVVNE